MVATVIAGEVKRDGATIGERALRGVGGLTQSGIGEADVVAVMLRNEASFLEAMLIARTAGCYSCPINWHYKADEAGYILRDCGAKALIIHADLLRQIDGGVPDGCRVIVVEPTEAAVARPSLPDVFEIVATLVVRELHVTDAVRSCVELSL